MTIGRAESVLLSAALIFGLAQPAAGAPCQKPIQTDFSKLITTVGRTYLVAGCLDIAPAAGFPVVLAFHGGGEDVHTDTDTGFADYSGLSSLSAVVVFITGQVSGNGQTWNSAFPWMDRPTPQDDAALVETILGDLANQVPKGTSLDMSRIYTVGKADGAGMATSLLCTNTGKFKFTAAASISGAHFGVNSATNFGTSRAQICLPKAAVPVLFVHGTGDTVMPYQGQNFVTAKALEASQKYWVTIDGAVTTTSSNTYTASMKDYVQAWATQANGCGAVPAVSTISSASTLTSFSGCKATIAAITIANGEHVWLGHAKSGPKSGQDPNMDFDVTPVIAAFFKIDVSRYTPTQALPQSASTVTGRLTTALVETASPSQSPTLKRLPTPPPINGVPTLTKAPVATQLTSQPTGVTNNGQCARDPTCFNNVYTCTACCSSGSVLGASGRIVTCWDSVFTPSRCCNNAPVATPAPVSFSSGTSGNAADFANPTCAKDVACFSALYRCDSCCATGTTSKGTGSCARDTLCFDETFKCDMCCTWGTNSVGKPCWDGYYSRQRCCLNFVSLTPGPTLGAASPPIGTATPVAPAVTGASQTTDVCAKDPKCFDLTYTCNSCCTLDVGLNKLLCWNAIFYKERCCTGLTGSLPAAPASPAAAPAPTNTIPTPTPTVPTPAPSLAGLCIRDASCFNSLFPCDKCCSTGTNSKGESCWTAVYTSTRCCVQPPKRRASCEDGDVLCPVWAQAGLCAGPTAEETVGLCQKSCNKCKRTDEPEAPPSVRYDREGSPYVTDNRGQLVRASFSFGEAGQLIDSRGNVIPLPSSSTPDALERGQAAPPEAKAAAHCRSAMRFGAPLGFAEPVCRLCC